MVVPDFELICEIMLVAEGFVEARLLARKFITLYTLCKELLSKQVGRIRISIPIANFNLWQLQFLQRFLVSSASSSLHPCILLFYNDC